MAKEVIWSPTAQDDRKKILLYWRTRNKSNAYSKKLNRLFKEAITLIAEYPSIGRPTDQLNIRIKIVREYLVVYEETDNQIYILAIWDGRQNPESNPALP